MSEPFASPVYLQWIRKQPCVVCAKLFLMGVRLTFDGRTAWGGVEAAHVGERGLGQKCSDLEAIPLCDWHHRIGPEAVHVLQVRFWEHHGLNRAEVIEHHQRDFYAEAA